MSAFSNESLFGKYFAKLRLNVNACMIHWWILPCISKCHAI